MSFVFSTTKSIINYPDSTFVIGEQCRKLQISRVILVTDPGIVGLGLHKTIVESLESASIQVLIFSDVQVDPPTSVIEQAILFAQQHSIDGVIGLGGGSSLDTAKLIAALTYSQQTLSQVMGVDNITQHRLPLIQVPTTSGTGSEVTPISIVTTEDSTKMGIVSDKLLPDVAMLDARLTMQLPPHITAATGIDAMVHAIEAYTSAIKKNAYSDMLAKEALRIMSRSIKTAVHHGSDLNARSMMMLGATLAGQAFANAPVAGVHALAYPLGGRFHIPHGLSNSLVLPHVLRFNIPSAAKLYAELADVILPDMSASLASDEDKSEKLVSYLEQLIADLGLPNTLESMGIKQQDLDMLAKDASEQERLLVNNPRPLTEADILSIYQTAFTDNAKDESIE